MDGYLLKNSVIYPNNDNGFVQEFANGEVKIFGDIKNNEEMPERIDFETGVDVWDDTVVKFD